MMFCSIRFRLAIILIHTIAVIVTSFWTQNITKWGAWQWSWLFTVRHSWNITQELTIHAINCLLVSKCFSMAPHIRSHRVPCSYFPKKLPLQLSSEQSVGDVKVMQLDWKRVLQARSRSCKSSAAITTECSRHHAVETSADCRERRVLSDMRRQSSAKWRGACPDCDWWTRHAGLNLTRSQMGSQWSSCNTSEIWLLRHVPIIIRAVVFCTNCSLHSRVSGRPQSSDLQ